ncbi:unnamed protein product [Litomosoides sigmodontis]|uniref:SOCS box domain-containing protein n=1 Tax=Litomosoides sigmodontis TaxID=42156 RepID=A0A3P6U400_LITSI|nr:unnamed protein product [Litomosoides sigmodontis]
MVCCVGEEVANPYCSRSPLHRAAHGLCIEKCKIMVEIGEYDVDVRAFDGRTPLMGANPNVEDKSGRKPLQYAVKSRHYNLVTLLIEYGAHKIKLTKKAQWLLIEAIKKNDKSMMSKFVRWGCSIFACGEDYYTPLMVAVSINYYSGAKWLLRKAGDRAAELADIQTGAGTCVTIAAAAGYASILQLLIKYGANCNILDSGYVHPITLAASNKYSEWMELLLPHVKREILMQTIANPVVAATRSQSFTCVYLLIKSGYSTEAACIWEEPVDRSSYIDTLFDRKNCTALYQASRTKNLPIIELLLNAGAKMTFTDVFLSPFLYVLRSYFYPHDEILLRFLKNDVDINAISVRSDFRVPDALLVSLSNPSLLSVLLSCGLDPMLKNWCECRNSRSLLKTTIRLSGVHRMKETLKLLLHYSPTIPGCCNEVATLCHLCRLSIRKLLPTSRLLHGEFVKDLSLPQRLKDYLTYRSTSFSSLPFSFQSLSI